MKHLFFWQLIGFVFTVFMGVVLHFFYEWSNEAIWAAPISSVNESTWEHMKLLFFPMFGFAIFQSLFFKKYKSFWNVKLKGILIGLLLIPLIYYFYNGAIGKSPDWVNIAIFVLSVAVSYVYEYKLFKANMKINKPSKEAIILLITIAFLFVLFTFVPIEIGIFKDPTSNTFGIK